MRFLVQLFLILLCASCAENDLGGFTLSYKDQRSFEDFERRLTVAPYTDNTGIKKWRENFKHIRLGMSVEEFTRFLGDPNVEAVATTNLEDKTRRIRTLIFFHVKNGSIDLEDHKNDIYYSAYFDENGLFFLTSNDSQNTEYDLGEQKERGWGWFLTYGKRSR